MPPVRPPAVDGLFYPASAHALRTRVEGLLAGAAREGGGPARRPKLLIAPHAGYDYSGAVAACAFALLASGAQPPVRRVVVLGPAHRVPLRGLAAPVTDGFATPLGVARVDTAALDDLAELPQVARNDRPHAEEHCIEVQLPFLQALLDNFSLVPLVVGDASPSAVAEVVERLWGGNETLIVISSDLSHYLHYHEARSRDAATIERILRFDAGIGPFDACGAAAIEGALLAARRHGLSPRLLDLRNSGDTAGGRDRVVGYCAIAFEEADR